MARHSDAVGAPKPQAEDGARALAAPPVRKLAIEFGVELSQVMGTGARGGSSRPTCGQQAPHPSDRREPLRGVRRAMARYLANAWREVPHISLFDELDCARQLLAAHTALRGRAMTASRSSSVVLCVRQHGRRARGVPDPEFLPRRRPRRARAPRRRAHGHRGSKSATAWSCPSSTTRTRPRPRRHRPRRSRARHRGGSRRSPLTGDAARRNVLGHQLRHRRRSLRDADRAAAAGRDPRLRGRCGCAPRRRLVTRSVAAPTLPLVSPSADHRAIDGRDHATGFLEHVFATLRATPTRGSGTEHSVDVRVARVDVLVGLEHDVAAAVPAVGGSALVRPGRPEEPGSPLHRHNRTVGC